LSHLRSLVTGMCTQRSKKSHWVHLIKKKKTNKEQRKLEPLPAGLYYIITGHEQ